MASSGVLAAKPQNAPANPQPELRKAQIKVCDMPKHMADAVVAAAITFLSQDVQQKDVATHLKRFFESEYGSGAHCIVGHNFASFVTHESKNYIYFYVGQVAILLWKNS